MNREELKNILPHREPMLLVDDVEMCGENECVAHYHVRGDEFFLQGHFPGNPIVPGVILCEMAAQSSAAIFKDAVQGKTPVYTGINNVKFRSSARPGDTLEFHCSLTRSKHPFYFISGEATVEGKKIMSGEFSFAIV